MLVAEVSSNYGFMNYFAFGMLFLTLGGFMFFLILAFRRHHLDDPECSKFEVFTTDPDYRPGEMPNAPTSCQPANLRRMPWDHAVNTGWFWVTIGFGLLWGLIMIGAFAISRVHPM
jgi:hypothetical protein